MSKGVTFTAPLELTRLGQELRMAVIARGYTVSGFAGQCNYDEKTIRNAFMGKCRIDTMRNLCEELGVPFQPTATSGHKPDPETSAEYLGAYQRRTFGEYIGRYQFIIGEWRELCTAPHGVCEWYWCDQVNGLRFTETRYFWDARAKRYIEDSRGGDVYIHPRVNLINMVATECGNVSAVTLARLSPDTATMGGIVLMSRWDQTHYLPAAAPIIYRRIAVAQMGDQNLPTGPFNWQDDEENDLVSRMEEVRGQLMSWIGVS